MAYVPKPIDLTEVKLSKSLEEDLEKIARNIHDTWALQRMQKGWEYGEHFDEKSLKHPCMVEYEKLPEPEKDIDRATAIQTIKMLLWMGYRIEKREEI
ncbi:MAG: RyR domain-containing protein [Bacteroidales bacterium]|nr:RyR domain-containing protein [Lachnoclostridium sp.]MCM1383896.1 RyR domain-containing protein [Lachnoclostridium sp.]MCM1464451.1 RyR domain-containing protein [Bacteroidales bacterium]